jgi:predicted ester cyclase
MKGITISRIEGGKIVEDWDSYDNLSVMQQLGLVPEQ